MRKVIVAELLTLDGVMESPENWQFPYRSEDVADSIQAQILGTDVMLLGRVTYETFAAFWPTQTHNEFGIADKLNRTPKVVVSTTLQKVEWNNSTVIKQNVLEEITRLKQQGSGNIGITGSATLAQSLMQADMIDEYQFMIHPIVVGHGIRLFKDGSKMAPLKLVDSKTFNSGVVTLTYQPDRK